MGEVDTVSFFDASIRGLIEISCKIRRVLQICRHDLRSPLGTIKTASQLALMGKGGVVSADLEKLLNMVSNNADRGLLLVDNLAAMTRVGHDWVPLRLEAVNVVKSVEECLQELKPEATRRNLQVELTLDIPEGCQMRADSTLTQAALKGVLAEIYRNSSAGAKINVRVSSQAGRRKSDAGLLLKVEVTSSQSTREESEWRHLLGEQLGDGGSLGVPLGELALCREVWRLQGGNLHFSTGESGVIVWNSYLAYLA